MQTHHCRGDICLRHLQQPDVSVVTNLPKESCVLCRIAIFGLAFVIATITQLQAALTRNFHYDMKDDLPTWFMWVLVVSGDSVSPNSYVLACE